MAEYSKLSHECFMGLEKFPKAIVDDFVTHIAHEYIRITKCMHANQYIIFPIIKDYKAMYGEKIPFEEVIFIALIFNINL